MATEEAELVYSWKRLLCPRGGNINLSDGGYLYDPDSEWGKVHNPNVVHFEELAGLSCLILLGEPGIGKTHALKEAQKVIDSKANTGDQTLWLDLGRSQSEDRLIKYIFENETILSWRKGENKLHLFLDNLDMGILRVDTITSLLIDGFKKFKNYHIQRLGLYIACRTGMWPISFEKELEQLWDKKVIGIYELAPLRKKDVIEAAKANGLDAWRFLGEIDRRNVVPLAIKPITLSLLINVYRSTQSLTQNQVELYLKGCNLLCEEHDRKRREAGLTGSFTAAQRMAAAARIAAVTVFTRRNAIWTDVDQGNVSDECATIPQLCGGSEIVNGDILQINENVIKETIFATGLFSSRGPDLMGWDHQTYAEFLAARYLIQNSMTTGQIMSLLVHPFDPRGRLMPQLHGVAAWVANYMPEVFNKIIELDPEILLRSDLSIMKETDRSALVDSLIRKYDDETLLDIDWDIRRMYGKLYHSSLEEQLKPYICDTTKGEIVRRVAIYIAEACGLKSLQDELANIALDPTQSMHIRVIAAHALCNVGENTTKAKLRPLATGDAREDTNDDLKGYGLRGLWPDNMKAEELFTLLTPPKKPSWFGAYWYFIKYELAQNLKPSDISTALVWVKNQKGRSRLESPISDLIDNIMLKAWENLNDFFLINNFSEILVSRLKDEGGFFLNYEKDSEFRNALTEDDQKRRLLLETMIPSISDIDSLGDLAVSSPPMILDKDFNWLIEHIKSFECHEMKRRWARLIRYIFGITDVNQIESVLSVCKYSPELLYEFKEFMGSIELKSAEADRLRERYQRTQQYLSKKEEKHLLLDPPPCERIAKLLDDFESGNYNAWWYLNRELSLEPDSVNYGSHHEPDLTVLPGWKSAEATTKVRIINAAKKYVLEHNAETSKWLGQGVYYHPALAGYRALQLLLQELPHEISTLPHYIWKNWAPIIIAFPSPIGIIGNEKNENIQRNLAKIAYQYASNEIIETLLLLIDEENKKYENIFITFRVESCWDNQLSASILEKAMEEDLKPKCMGKLLAELLDHNVEKAKEFAESLVSSHESLSGDWRYKAVIAASVLINHAEDAGWASIWPVIQFDPEFGKEIIISASRDYYGIPKTQKLGLKEDQLADLFVWLAREFPYKEDIVHEGVFTPGPRDDIASFRDSMLNRLKQKGTQEACNAIQRITKELPELDSLKWTLFEAQIIFLQKTWKELRPSDIIALSSNKHAHLVQNGDQLLDILIGSIDGLEQKLQGHTASAIDLWDQSWEAKTYRPRDENRFSNYLKSHLDTELRKSGVIVNREVEIRRGEGATPGERTDIHVDAVIPGHGGEIYDSIKAIIEVKGCWNLELDRAMETQLVERYLKNSDCNHGLYLVGWFNCEHWDNKDTRKMKASKLKIEELREQLNEQARLLSHNAVHVRARVINAALR
jgi:predicted NACHT family NTPase